MNAETSPWKVMIADDEPAFRTLASRYLCNLSFEGRLIEILEASSAAEAKQILREHDNIAVILLDVRMESPNAGYDLVRHIRETMGNHSVRIVLASGLFERKSREIAIVDYDVNDAIDKADILDARLCTTVIKALRSYRDILRVNASLNAVTENGRPGGEIAEECDRMLESCLAAASCTSRSGNLSGLVGSCRLESMKLVAGCGRFTAYRSAHLTETLYEDPIISMLACVKDHRPIVTPNSFTAAYAPTNSTMGVIHIEQTEPFAPHTLDLIRLVSPNLVTSISCIITADNGLSRDVETMSTIHALVSTRSRETGKHVRRVGLTSEHLALLVGVGEREAETIGYAAQLHDVGKVGVPDNVLHKPGHLTEMEYQLMMIHTRLGHRILSANSSTLFSTAATIALNHHERWDGQGYPNKLHGEDIPLAGRIVAICDVFDALTHERSYRKAMTIKRAVGIIRKEHGRAFDPRLTDLFLNHIDEFLAIGNSVNDPVPSPRPADGLSPAWMAMTG